LRILSKRVSDRRFKGLIGRFLRVGIVDAAATYTQPEVGTPQGSVMSPVLANIFLHEVLDKWFMKNHASGNAIIVRYADDAVFFFQSQERAVGFLKELEQQVSNWGLALNKEKTHIINFDRDNVTTFNFLGFTFYWAQKRAGKKSLKVKIQRKTLHRKIQEFYEWIKSVRSKWKLAEIWSLAKAKLIGHYQYYGFADNRTKLNHFYREAIGSMFKWLNRRSQMRSYSWEQFERRLESNPLPTPPPMAKLIHLEWRWGYA
jgi:RNA-directed DNA polymerase